MLGRLATYVVPSASVFVAALVLLGPGVARPAPFVRVRGVPVLGGRLLSLRLEGARRGSGVDAAAPLADLLVEARGGGPLLSSARVSLDAEGVGEASLSFSDVLTGPLDLRVLQGANVLAEGRIDLREGPSARVSVRSIAGVSRGHHRFIVSTGRGVFAAPFPETLRVAVGLPEHVSPYRQGFSGIQLSLSAEGAKIHPDKRVTDEAGEATFTVTPLAHHVELEIAALDPLGNEGHWEGLLPVRPGAIWLDPDIVDRLAFVSPSPRGRAYVSVVSETGRIFGATVPLVADEAGFFRGSLPSAEAAGGIGLVVAGDPGERGDATVVWPLPPGEGAAEASRLELLLDGGGAAEARERGRASRARLFAVLLVVVTAVAEVLLIVVRSRSAQRQLEARLGEASEGAEREAIVGTARAPHAWLRVALAISLVLLAFTVVAALSTFR